MSEFPRGYVSFKRSMSFFERLGEYADFHFRFPFVVKRATGVYLRDIDGNKFVDFDLFSGALLLGHRPPQISKFVKNTISTTAENYYLEKWHFLLSQELSRRYGFKFISLFDSFTSALNSVSGEHIHFTSSNGWPSFPEFVPEETVLVARFGFIRHSTDFLKLLARFRKSIRAVVLGEELSAGFPIGVVMSDCEKVKSGDPYPFSCVAGFKNLFLADKRFNSRLMEKKAKWLKSQVGGEALGSSLRLEGVDNNEMLKWGVVSSGGVFHLSPAHSQNDLIRLKKAILRARG